MERTAQHRTTSHPNSRKDNSLSGSQTSANQTPVASASNKKWSFGRLFRRKKEIATESSSEEDRKAGFVPHQQRQPPRVAGASGSSVNLKSKSSKSHKVGRNGKLNGASFDHIVVNPQMAGAPITPPHPPPPAHVDHEFFLPVETISPTEAYYQNQQQQYLQHDAQSAAYTRSANSLDRRAARAALKTRSAQRLPHESALGAHSSSEEELISLNSSTFSKYRSDESIHSGGQGAANAQSRRSRGARNERYYKRLSRDGEPSNGQVPVMYAPQPTQRWKTQPVPLSIYNPTAQVASVGVAAAAATPRLRNTSSLQHVAPYVQWGQLQQQPKHLQNSVNDSKRSISYDSHIHLQNINGRLQTKPLPPPPPPRDPLRRVNVSGQMQNGSAGDLRPISYAFDQSGLPTLPTTSQRMGGRCVSDDKIWSGPAGPHYQSVHSLNTPNVSGPNMQATPHHRRFITRAERDAHPAKKSLPNGIEFHYVADATPRSRKPIHMLEPQLATVSNDVATSSILRTSKSGLPTATSKQMQINDFWKRLDAGAQHRGRDAARAYAQESNVKPRSISSSRVGELRAYPIPVYSEVHKLHKKPTQASPQPGADELDSIVCGSLHIKSKPDSNSNFVEIRNKDYSKSSSVPNHYQRRSGEIPNTPNKYDEYVAEKREQHHKPIFTPPTPPQRKLSIPPSNVAELPIYFPRKKPANLEEAINELEAIYKSLGLTEEPEKVEKAEKTMKTVKTERVPTPSEFEKYALAHAHEYDDEDSPTGEPDPIRDDVAYRNMQLANLQHKTVEKQPPFGIPVGPVVAAPQNDYLHVTSIVEPIQSVNTPDIVKDDLAVRALRKDPPGAKDKFIYPYSSFQKKNRATRTQSANIYNLIHRDAAKPSGGDLYSYLELTRSLERAGSMSDLHRDVGATAADVPTTLALLRNLKEQEQQQQQQQSTPQTKVTIPFRHPSQGGAICALPEKLPSSAHKEEVHKPPVPLPRKSLTPEPAAANAQMEDALNKIAMDAQEKSEKLTKELQELRKEALITAARPKAASAEEERLEKDLQEIEAVSEAAKRCGKMLLDTLPDANESTVQAKPRKLHKEGKLIEAIDQVSEAANAVCEKILKDIVTTEPPVVIQEAVQVKNKQTPTEMLVMPNLIKKLDPIQSEQIEAIAKRCMRQLSALADDNPDYDNLNQELKQQQQQQSAEGTATAVACNVEHLPKASAAKVDNLISTVAEVATMQPAAAQKQHADIEEIDQIMQECEEQMRAETINTNSSTTTAPPLVLSERTLAATRTLGTTTNTANTKSSSGDDHTTAPSMTTSSYCSSSSSNNVVGAVKPGASTTASSFSSSSDCLAKSSSPSAGRRQSSSITSFNPYSSSDYIKSPSSEYHALSTDPIKTFSSTSYDVKSTTSATPNISATTNSTFSYSPSPPLNLTPVSETAAVIVVKGVVNKARATSATRQSQERTRTHSLSSPSQYNSSEELAMIFGIDEQPRRQRAQQQAKEMQSAANVSGKTEVTKLVHVPSAPLTSSSHASALHANMLETATTTTTIFTTANATQLYTNPNIVAVAKACESVATDSTNNKASLNVIAVVDDNVKVDVDIDVKDTTTTTTTTNATTTTSISTITTNNPTTIAINTNTKNSSISLSPSSYKLASIPESQADELAECTPPKLSPNFNKIYASKISIIVEGVTTEPARNLEHTAQCDSSLSSCEDETSSNPDSGNVSLADYPLTSTQMNNACLQLQSAYNSRFEVKKKKRHFVNEISIERIAVEPGTEVERKTKANIDEFPPPPSEEELLDSLIEVISVRDAGKETIEEEALEQGEINSKNNIEILQSQFECLEDNQHLQGSSYNLEGQITKENNFKESSSSENDMKMKNMEKCASSEKLMESENREETHSLDENIISENSLVNQYENLYCTSNVLSRCMSSENLLKHSEIEQNQNTKSIERKSRSIHKLDDADLIELAQLVRSSSGSRRNSETSITEAYSADSEYNSAEELKCTTTTRISTELEQLRLAFSDLLARNLTDLDELPRIEEEDDIKQEEETKDSAHSEMNDQIHETPGRKLSIVYETPPLKLSISEVKISYSPADQLERESAAQDVLTQITQCTAQVESLNGALNAMPEKELKMSSNAAAPESGSLLPWRRMHDASALHDELEDDEKPSTSAAAAAAAVSAVKTTNQRRALSIFGELRPTAAMSSLTTLEHVLLACSLGVITPTDLYTLCLIIIGMITIIAIVLF